MSLHARELAAHVPGPPPRWLFRGLALRITPGEVWAVVGPNGSGKSTLLRCLAGLRRAEEGIVHLHDRSLAELPARERAQHIAYLPQTTPLYHDLRVRQVVMLGRAPHLSRWHGPDRNDERCVDEALARVDATELAQRPVSTLSGGERQRAMLARLLATGASLMLLDEPTTALDVGHALRLLALCRELAATGVAVVLAMHEIELARRYADHSVCLGAGPAGEHHLGPTSRVLTPTILSTVFEVDVHEHPDGLSFHPHSSS